MHTNTLIIVGSGIKFMSHLTVESIACIEKADKVLYLVNEPMIQEWIQKTNKFSESLDFLYTESRSRTHSYSLISEYIIDNLKKFKTLCVIMYGHPTVLVQPSVLVAQAARKNNYNVIIMPAISSEACLFADLCIDPGSCGCQSFEATDFLIYRREYDSSCHLILWQASVIGVLNQPLFHDPIKGLEVLVEYLHEKYELTHEIVVYEAAQYPRLKPKINQITLQMLSKVKIDRTATLYIPPNMKKLPDEKMIEKIKKILV